MTFYDQLIQPDNGQPATPIHIVDKDGFDGWLAGQPDAVRTAVRAQKFVGAANDVAILPGERPADWSAVAGVADAAKLGVWNLAKAADSLPEGSYRLVEADAGEAMLGWMLGQYRYDEYLSEAKANWRARFARQGAGKDCGRSAAGGGNRIGARSGQPACGRSRAERAWRPRPGALPRRTRPKSPSPAAMRSKAAIR